MNRRPITSHVLTLLVHDEGLAVARLEPEAPVPAWAWSGAIGAVVRTRGELSVVCPVSAVPAAVTSVGPWRAIEVSGPLDLGLVGVMHALTAPLAASGISVFVISTFDTDYLLVRADDLDRACSVLRDAGHTLRCSTPHAPSA
jgi:hypothetical protein